MRWIHPPTPSKLFTWFFFPAASGKNMFHISSSLHQEIFAQLLQGLTFPELFHLCHLLLTFDIALNRFISSHKFSLRALFSLGHLWVSSLPMNTGCVCPVLWGEVPSCWISPVLPELLPHSNISWAKLCLAWNVTVRERKDTRKLFFLGRGSCAGRALVQLNVSRAVRRLLKAVQ